MHSPTLGRADAPVVIVEFLDPACETCRDFYPRVKQLLAAHPEQIRLVLPYATIHNGSDKVVVAVLEAARKQDKFWPALEALLATQADWSPQHTPQVARVWKHLAGLGLNMEQMAFDLTAPEITRVIEQECRKRWARTRRHPDLVCMKFLVPTRFAICSIRCRRRRYFRSWQASATTCIATSRIASAYSHALHPTRAAIHR